VKVHIAPDVEEPWNTNAYGLFVHQQHFHSWAAFFCHSSYVHFNSWYHIHCY